MVKEVFSEIAKEIETGQLDAALWTQAFAECDGDADKTKALYIRLRFTELEKTELRASPHVVSMPAPAIKPAAIFSSELDRIRGSLKHLLAITGKRSLYGDLKLSPQCSDADIGNVIAEARAKKSSGEVVSADMEYAIAELGDTFRREAYDRRIFLALTAKQKAESEGLIGRGMHDDSAPRRGLQNLSIVIGISAILLFGLLSLGFLRTKVDKDIATEVVANQREAIQVTKENDAYRATTERTVGVGAVDNQTRAIEHSSQIANRREDSVQRHVENNASIGNAQIEIERERLEEQKKQAAWQREQREQARIERALDNLLLR